MLKMSQIYGRVTTYLNKQTHVYKQRHSGGQDRAVKTNVLNI